MGKIDRNRICRMLFWAKFCVALTLACGGLSLLAWNVKLHWDRAAEKRILTQVQTQPVVIDETNVECQHSTNGRARLEPPDGVLLPGFHLDWEVQTPQDIVQIFGADMRQSV
jgi:hypothetical protein